MDHPIKRWSSTQSVIALSTGEAEMYAINNTAATGMGGQSILNDLGVTLDLRVFTDATTGKALVSRRGLGKVRHIAVNELWLQSHVQAKTLVIVKIKNKFNPSDVLTKHLTRAELQMIMEHVQHMFEEGRPAAAPKLVSKTSEVNAIGIDNTVCRGGCNFKAGSKSCRGGCNSEECKGANNSNVIGGVFTCAASFRLQQLRCHDNGNFAASVMQQRRYTLAQGYSASDVRALTTNLPGFVCAYGGHTSPAHQWGVRQLHEKQCRGESFPAPPAWWRYTRTGNLRPAYYSTKLCYRRQVKQQSNSPVPAC